MNELVVPVLWKYGQSLKPRASTYFKTVFSRGKQSRDLVIVILTELRWAVIGLRIIMTRNGYRNENNPLFDLVYDLRQWFPFLPLLFLVYYALPGSCRTFSIMMTAFLSSPYWTPPIFQNFALKPCPVPIRYGMCSCLSELVHRYNSTERSWADFSGFYLDQMRSAEDDRTRSAICVILDIAYAYYHYQGRVPFRAPEPIIERSKGWRQESSLLHKKFRHIQNVSPVWAYNHHGLRWLPRFMKDYIRERDIIDVGASVGDSLTVLDQYTDHKVVSYELIPKTAEIAKEAAAHLAAEKHLVLLCGLSNFTGNVNVSTHGSAESTLHSNGSVGVPISTIDIEAKRLNLTVGVIKADVEGYEIDVLKGALETIQRDRPIITMSIYHNVEFLDLPKFLLQLGYKLRFDFGQYSSQLHWEMICLATPNMLHENWIGINVTSEARQRCPPSFH
jgi:FkbM family methyltransferase